MHHSQLVIFTSLYFLSQGASFIHKHFLALILQMAQTILMSLTILKLKAGAAELDAQAHPVKMNLNKRFFPGKKSVQTIIFGIQGIRKTMN